MIAWVLIANFGMFSAYTIPGIASEEACEKLAMDIGYVTYRCVPYSAAAGGNK
jgi:hypothetical protein